MRIICELNDSVVLGTGGLSDKAPRHTARAVVKTQDDLYAVMYSAKFHLYSLPGGGIEGDEDALTAVRREVYEETGCICDSIEELGVVAENRASLDYTQINHYFMVNTSHASRENHLTAAERANRTEVQWHPLDEAVRLIKEQAFERVQQKYLQARDVAALDAYCALLRRKEQT